MGEMAEYYKYDFKSKQYEGGQDDMMKKNDGSVAPRFRVGDVLDIRYVRGGLPNRALIKGIWIDDSVTSWNYDIQLESDLSVVSMSEEYLESIVRDRTAPIYKLPVIIRRYASGWRFFGNVPTNKAVDKANSLAKIELLKNVRLSEAYNRDGKLVGDQNSIWIRYYHRIKDAMWENEAVMTLFSQDIK